jgi:hypothetical protein
MQPVWVLSVDLQTKTATFQSGLSDAAKSARGAFTQIRSGAGEMGRETSGHMMEARHSVMMLGEEFGVHLPRALTSFIASIGPIGAALEAAFPFLAIALGATLLLEHLAKMRAAGLQLTEDQEKFGTAVNNAFNTFEAKLINSQIRVDELTHNHLDALRLKLELIDHQSMDELAHAFEGLAKDAEVVMKGLEGHWYTFGVGSDEAKRDLEVFQNKYQHLLSLHTEAGRQEATNLLTGTLKTAEDVLHAQQIIKANRDSGGGQTDDSFQAERLLAINKQSLAVTQSEIDSHEALVGALREQVSLEQVSAMTAANNKKADKGADTSAQAGIRAAAQREAAESQLRMGEMAVSADRAIAKSQLDIHRASVEERLKSDLDFADREQALHLAANQAEIAALDKSGKDYQNQLKALKDKALEISAQHEAQVTELTARAATEAAARDLRNLEQAEREKIDHTVKGTKARLAVLDAAIKEEESKNLQDTNFYRELLSQRVNLITEMAEEEKKLKAEAGQEEAAHEQKMGELILAAQKQHQELLNSAHHVSDAQRVAQETAAANAEYQIKLKAFQKEEAALDKSGKDYANKLKALQDKEKQLTQQHENEITAIKEKAEEQRNSRILSANNRFADALSSNLTKTLMGHQSFAKMINQLGDQVVSGMIQNAIKSMLTDDMTKERDAAAAARKAFNIGMSIGGPAGIVLGPVMGAAAFAAVMAFQGGTDAVPGVGTGDIVPAMLTPGEGVVPKGVMEGLSNLAKSGGLSGGPAHVTHIHGVHFAPTIHALDSDGVDTVLEKHQATFQKHFENVLRKQNR